MGSEAGIVVSEVQVETLQVAQHSDWKLFQQAEELSFPEGPMGPYLLAPLLDHGGGILYRRGDSILAYALLQGNLGSVGEVLVFSFAVLPDYRGQGVGGRFLPLLLQYLEEEKFTRVELYCSPTNEAALRLYRRHGFKQTESLPEFYGPGEDRVRMLTMLGESKR